MKTKFILFSYKNIGEKSERVKKPKNPLKPKVKRTNGFEYFYNQNIIFCEHDYN